MLETLPRKRSHDVTRKSGIAPYFEVCSCGCLLFQGKLIQCKDHCEKQQNNNKTKIHKAVTAAMPAGAKYLALFCKTPLSCTENAPLMWVQACYKKGIPIYPNHDLRKRKVIMWQLRAKGRRRIESWKI